MLSPRWSKVFADVWSNKTRTALVVLSIAVGVFAVGMVAGTNAILAREVVAAYMAVNPADASLYPDAFDDELVYVVRDMPGVKEAAASRSISVRLQTGPDQWRDMTVFAVPDFDDIRINQLRPFAGAYPPRDREVLFERSSLPLAPGKRIGDSVTVELPDGRRRELRIAGTVYTPNLPPAALFNNTYTYVTFETLEWLGAGPGYTELSITVEGDRLDKRHITEVAKRVRDKVEAGGRTVYFTWIPEPATHPADSAIRPLLLLLGVLGTFSLFASGFLVVNTIAALLTQQVRQIGMMKAIGARRLDIFLMYLATVLLFGLLALAVAAPLAYAGAAGLATLLGDLMNTILTSYALPAEVWLLMAAIALLVPLVAALQPVFAGVSVTVREAVSGYGLGRGRFGRGWLDRLLERVRFLSRPLLLALRNTFRRKGRLALTLATLTLSGVIFIAVISVRDSMLLTLDDAIKYFNYDVQISFSRPYRVEQIARVARSLPGVTAAESWGFSSVRRVRPDDTESDSYTMIAPPADARMIVPTVLAGRWLVAGDERAVVVNTSVTRKEPDVAVGSTLTLTIDGRESDWRVVGVVRGIGDQAILYANYPFFARETRLAGRAAFGIVQIQPNDPASQRRMAALLEERFEREGMQVSQTQTIASIREQNEVSFNIIVAFLLVMALLLAVVGGLGLMGTMSINVIERTREIGVMRAIGASDGQVLRIVLAEGVTIGVLSWALAAALALPLSKLLSDAVGFAFFQTALTYAYAPLGALIWLALVVVIAALASVLPARGATRLTVREVLAYE
ncbi:MAG TPA: FtsX-like permease family protein [Roseiflexaceae bacterium]|nr:FtsX-like permease family protein [Roseiflexaceae bacterium]